MREDRFYFYEHTYISILNFPKHVERASFKIQKLVHANHVTGSYLRTRVCRVITMRRQLDVQTWSPNLDGSEGCGLRRQALIEVQLIKTVTRLRDRHRWRYTCTITSARILAGDVDPRVTVSSRALGGDRSIALRGYRKHIDTAPLRFLLGKRSWRSLIARRFMNVQSRQSTGGGSTNRYPDEKVLVRPVKIKIIIAIFFEYSIICERYAIIF